MSRKEETEKREALVDSEWQDMPEFIQEKQTPFAKITVRFDTEEALNEFSELIGQKLTPRTKSIWHPKLIRGKNANLRYVDDDS
jgi:hypothetical protein